MAGEASRNKVNIGASSLILIFIVLCMATFGLLSLSSAQGDLKLAGRNGEAVRAYYEADSRGQQWLKEVDQVLTEEMGGGKGFHPVQPGYQGQAGRALRQGNRTYFHGHSHGQGTVPAH